MLRKWLAACMGLVLVAQAVGQEKLDFAHDVLPILKARCAECHTNGKYKGGLSFDTRGELLKSKDTPGEFLRRIASKDPEVRMPPKGEPLSDKEIAVLKLWHERGYPWETGFSFKISNYVAPLQPRRPDLPPAQGNRTHSIDRIIDAYHAKHRIPTPADADDITFVRRLYLDVLGLLPTPAEVEAFRQDASPDRKTRLIDRVLSDRRAYADHWLSFWNDLLRNDYAGTGYIDGGRKQISGWLYHSLHDNKPYDQFVRELLAPSVESEGFINGIKWRGNVNASQVREVQFAQNVSQVFFGINLKCASCHDSFIDTWKLDDAYGLAAIVAEKPLTIHRCDKATEHKAVPHFLWPELGDIDAKAPKAQRLQQLAQLVTHPENGRFTRTMANRLWMRLLGRGVVHPVDMMGTRPWNDDLLDHLGVTLQEQGYDLKKLMAHILNSRAYQARSIAVAKEPTAEDYRFQGPEVRRMSAEMLVDALTQLTGHAPYTAAVTLKVPASDDAAPAERRFVRAALAKSDPLLRSLGRPNREQVVTMRGDLLTTLQALDLSNGQVFTDLLNRGAARWLKTAGKQPADDLIQDLYLRALSRRATEAELAEARLLLGPAPAVDGMADLLWCVVMLPEFQLIR